MKFTQDEALSDLKGRELRGFLGLVSREFSQYSQFGPACSQVVVDIDLVKAFPSPVTSASFDLVRKMWMERLQVTYPAVLSH